MPDEDTPAKERSKHSEEGWDTQHPENLRGAVVRLLHPVPLTVLLILLSVLALIGANVFGWDSGRVLTRMADHEFARGLITYLFAVTTIGAAVVLILAALMGRGAMGDPTFERGKEILALLLGVFGTIVGFYFGSEAHASEEEAIRLSQPLLSATSVAPGDSIEITAFVSGGTPPWSYGIAFGTADMVEYAADVRGTGWITTRVVVPAQLRPGEATLVLGVRDRRGQTMTRSTTVTIVARPP